MKRDIVFAVFAVAALAAVALLSDHREPPAGATRASGDFGATGYRGWYELLAREGIGVARFRHRIVGPGHLFTRHRLGSGSWRWRNGGPRWCRRVLRLCDGCGHD